MNLHDNRNSTKEAVQKITDVKTLQDMVSGLIDKAVFYEAQLDMVKRDRRRLSRQLGKLSKANVIYTVMTPDGFVLARYKNLGSAETFRRKCVGYSPDSLLIKTELTEMAN